MQKTKGFSLIGIILILAALTFVAGGTFYIKEKTTQMKLEQLAAQKEQERLELVKKGKITSTDIKVVGKLPEITTSSSVNASTTSTLKTYRSQQECESVSGQKCWFQMCDYECPPGDNTGWVPQKKSLQPSDTSTWKIYRNDKYGFEVKYPPDWSIIAGNTGQPGFRPKGGDYIYTRLHVSGTQEYIYSLAHADEDNCPDNMTGAACPRGAKPKEIKEININDISGYFTERESGSLSAYLPRPDKKIAIELNTRHPEYRNVFNQILSTFKFTK